jgi:hypothetical protein
MLNGIMLYVIMLMLNAIMLGVVAPLEEQQS